MTSLATLIAISFALLATPAAAATVSDTGTGTHASLPNVPTTLSGLDWRGGTLLSGSTESAKLKTLCSTEIHVPGGVYPISTSEAYLENWSSGNLTVCGGGADTTIATPPAGFSYSGYAGMAGVKVSGKLDLILISWGPRPSPAVGWYCLNATPTGCQSTAGFTLPSSFCSSESAGYCNPDGLVIAKTLAFTYVDVINEQMVSCSAHAVSCSVDGASADFSGFLPSEIVQSRSTLYVSDNSCTGYIWEGSTTSMTVLTHLGDALGGIAFHQKTLYVADWGTCTSSPAHIIDVKTGSSLPTPFTGPEELIGLDSDLQWGSYQAGGVYSD